MKAIILAAGRGSRMKNLTKDKPKCLLEINGKVLIDMQLESLLLAGISDVGVVTGYRRELIASRVYKEFFNPRWSETNMVSSLECASSWLEQEPCIVSYSDIYYEPRAVESLMNSEFDLAITYDCNWFELWSRRFDDPLSDAETFRLNPDGFLAQIGKRPHSIDEIQGQYMGLLRFTPKGWAEIVRIRNALSQEDRDSIHMTGILQKVIEAARVKIACVPYYGEWGEFDSVDDIAALEKYQSFCWKASNAKKSEL